MNRLAFAGAVWGALAVPGLAWGACVNPAGVEGQQYYNSTQRVMAFCDGTSWRKMGGVTVGGSSSANGPDTSIQYKSGSGFGGNANFVWNNTSSIVSVTGTVSATSISVTNLTVNGQAVTGGVTTPVGVSGSIQINNGGAFGGLANFVVDTSGRVGIGTASPAAKLNVVGSSGLAIGAALTGDNAFTPAAAGIVLSGANQAGTSTYTSPGNGTTIASLSNYADSSDGFKRYLDIAALGSTGGATSNIRFLTGTNTATERMRIDGSGNVGIGTASPFSTAGYTFLTINHASGGGYTQYNYAGAAIGWTGAENNIFKVGSRSGSRIDFQTDGSNDRMTIDTSGNVGIGTTAPAVKFQAGNTTNAAGIEPRTDGVMIDGVGAANYARIGGFYQTNPIPGAAIGFAAQGASGQRGALTFLTKIADDNTTQPTAKMVINPAGNVGIGTTAPGYKLDVVGGSFANTIYSRATDGSMARIGLMNTNRHWTISNYGTGFTPNGSFMIADETAGAVRLSIGTSGNVGIGLGGATAKLHIQNSAGVACGDQLRLDNGTNYWDLLSGGSSVFYFCLNGSPVASITAGGVFSNSDAILKTNVQALSASSGLAAIERLAPVTFNWKDRSRGASSQFGFIAQDVQKVFPTLVTRSTVSSTAAGNTLMLNYQGLIAPMIKAIQELKADNDNQAAVLKAANDNVEALRRDFEAYKKAHP